MTTSKVCEHCGALVLLDEWYFHLKAHIPSTQMLHVDWCQDPNCEWKRDR